eukprot:9482065-Pyramimonas_sp.AAC.1
MACRLAGVAFARHHSGVAGGGDAMRAMTHRLAGAACSRHHRGSAVSGAANYAGHGSLVRARASPVIWS